MPGFGRSAVVRRGKLLDALQRSDLVRVQELAATLSVSEITIRRDLDELVAQGVAERFHGGARLIAHVLSAPAYSAVAGDDVKARIAVAAAQFVKPGDTVMLSGGSTTLAVFRAISRMEIRIVTNNAMIIGEISEHTRAELFVLGGEYNSKTRALNGDLTNMTLNEIHGNVCFLGTNAVSLKTGLTSAIYAAASVNRLMANQCDDRVVVVADASKIGATSHFVSLPLSRVSRLVTDPAADADEIAGFRAANMDVVICEGASR